MYTILCWYSHNAMQENSNLYTVLEKTFSHILLCFFSTGSYINNLKCTKTRWRSWGRSRLQLRRRGPSLPPAASATKPSSPTAVAEPAATARVASAPAVVGVSLWEPIRSASWRSSGFPFWSWYFEQKHLTCLMNLNKVIRVIYSI